MENLSKYKSLGEWAKNDRASYDAAYRNGMLPEICEMFGWEVIDYSHRKPAGYWTLELLQKEGKKYNGRREWADNDPASYKAAQYKGLLEYCCDHMKYKTKPPGYWTKEKCLEDGRKYNTKQEWRQKSKTIFRAAYNGGWLKECTAHMVRGAKPAGYWKIKENVLTEARKYSIRSKWAKASNPSYQSAMKNGWFEECIEHMESPIKPKKYWNKERCLVEAKKYTTIKDWRKNSGGSYKAAQHYGWLKECTVHIVRGVKPTGYWKIKENVLTEARKYSSKQEWRDNSRGSKGSAMKHGWYDECMEIIKQNGSK